MSVLRSSATAAASHSSQAHTVSAWSLLGQLVIGLAVILAIILVASRLLGGKGKGKMRLGAGRRQAALSVIARQSMGKGVAVAAVRAGQRVYLLGVTQHQVTRIDELDADALAEPAGPPVLLGDDPPAARILTWRGRSPARPGAGGGAAGGRPSAGLGALVRQLQERSVRR